MPNNLNHNNAIKGRSLKLALLPIAGITLILTALLAALYLTQLSKISLERGYHLSRLFAQLTYQSMHNRLLLQSVVHTSVTDSDIIAVRVYDLNKSPLIHSGPRFSPEANINPEKFGLDPSHQELSDSTLYIVPIHADHDAFAPFGWLIVEISTDDFTLLEYKTLLLAILAGLIAACLSAYLVIGYSRQIGEGIDQILKGIKQLKKGQHDLHIEATELTEFDDVFNALNSLALGLKETQDDIQRNIDQSIEDLRETLETIEIQNIELDLARKEAVEASRVKSDFLANTSHEIRTPLNGIIGFTSLLLKTTVSEQQREYLRTIQSSSQGLLTIINDVLDFSKIETGRLQLDYIPLHLRHVIEDAMQIMAPAAHEKNIQLILHIDRKLPSHLLGDPLRLKQILTNLVSNAIKFSSGGNVIINAALKATEETQVEVEISVQDSGVGVSEQDREKLFQAFSQIDTSNTRKHGGTGLGLAVSKGLIRRMNGEIGVKSSGQGGALFWFTARFGVEQESYQQEATHLLANCHFGIYSANEQLANHMREIIKAESGVLFTGNSIAEILTLVKSQSQINQPLEVVFYDIEPQLERNFDLQNLAEFVNKLLLHYSCKTVFLTTPSARRAIEHNLTNIQCEYLEKPLIQSRVLSLLRNELMPEKEETKLGRKIAPFDTRPKILAVDDNPANLQLVGELLNGLGMDVTLASDGKQAIELAERQLFDLIFMDLQMPIMDGIEATKVIRNKESGKRRTPIVALTAHAMAEQKSQLLLAGMDDYLSKPVSEAQLAHIINRWLKARNLQKNWLKLERSTDALTPDIDVAPESPKIVDLNRSLVLANNKPNLAKDMLSMLLIGLKSDQDNIKLHHSTNDYDALEAVVHRLHGGCCYCGVEALRLAAHDLDKSLQCKDYSAIKEQVERLDCQINNLQNWASEHDLDILFEIEEQEAGALSSK
ncbi:ATP-binding protein [Simiduia litorea]